MMVEYINKVNAFIANPPEKYYNLTNVADIKDAFEYIMNDPYIQTIKYLAYDITGHIDSMNELGTQFITNLVEDYEITTLILHTIGSLIIYFTYFIFVSEPIKNQLRIVENLINIVFSIPPSIYNTSSKMRE